MWVRNALFIGLLCGGALALGANLMPPREPPRLHTYESRHQGDPALRESIRRADAAIAKQWAEQSLQPAPIAPDLVVARRLALGLMGTIPSLEEIRQFERLPAEQRLAWWLDHVLDDRRHADYLAERLARACVGTEDGPFIFYRRRRLIAWLSDQIAGNRPYNELVHDLIAADGLWTDSPATNFVTVTVTPENKNQPDPIRLAGRVTRAFLGLRLDCAQCHNHPFAEWKQADFQSLSAFFGQTHLGFTGIYDGEGDYIVEDAKVKVRRAVAPRVPFAPELLPESGSRRERLAAWVTDAKNPYFARAAVNRVWALLLGRPLVDPVDNLESDLPLPPVLQVLADDFTAHSFDLRRLIRVIAGTEAFARDSAAPHEITEEMERAWAAFPLTRLRPEQVAGSALQAASLSTIDSESHIFTRIARFGQQNDFLKRYGDSGEDEFGGRGGTIPQRLLLMNGQLIHEKIKEGPLNAATRLAWMTTDDTKAVETAYLTVLSRRPTAEEAEHFRGLLSNTSLKRAQRMEDLFWALINSTEFSWNH